MTTPRTPEEYRSWWQASANVPYGRCWCGCNQQTPIAKSNKRGNVVGEPRRYVQGGHARREKRAAEIAELPEPNPSGLCLCGCGQKTPIAAQTHTASGWVKDKPTKYVSGHGPQLLSYSRKVEIVHRYLSGESSTTLAAKHGISSGNVSNYVRQLGYEVRPHKYKKGLNDADWDRVCDEYQAGATTIELGERHGLATGTISRTLAARGILAHGKLSVDNRQSLLDYYREHGDLSVTARRYGISREAVRHHVSDAGIKVRPSAEVRRKYYCDDRFFDHIDTERKAYWLGFIGADGYVQRGRVLSIALARKDEEHLWRLKSDLGASNPIYRTSNKCSNGTITLQARLVINSAILVSGLAQHGIHSAKSLSYEWPHFLSDELLRHYLRGYFDGDGCFSIQGGQVASILVGSESFLLAYQEYLVRTLGFRRNPLRTSGAIHRAGYGGNRQMAKLASLLYTDTTIYLPRKREKVAHLL